MKTSYKLFHYLKLRVWGHEYFSYATNPLVIPEQVYNRTLIQKTIELLKLFYPISKLERHVYYSYSTIINKKKKKVYLLASKIRKDRDPTILATVNDAYIK